MSVSHRLLQRIQNTAADTKIAVGRNADRNRDVIGRFETDTLNVFGQLIIA